MGATDTLRGDHRLAWRLEALIVACCERLEAGGDVPLADIGAISSVIDGFMDAVHHSREENTYFACVGAYGMASEIRAFLIEHEFARRVAAKVASHLARWRAGEDAREPVCRFLRAYAVFLRDHMTKEEAFFEEAEDALSEEEEAEMRDYFESAGADMATARRAEAEIAALEAAPWARGGSRARGS